jgi:16S rRNA (uracil1498-N3)-methyltransferase
MPRHDFRTPRLYVDHTLAERQSVPLDREQANYLLNVLRCKPGDDVLLFNGQDGEWQARLARAGKKPPTAELGKRAREQPPARDIHFLFAPLKHARLDYLVQKAVEMGATRLQPVITQHTQVSRVNLKRMRGNVIEGAQQCGILTLAEVGEPVVFARVAGHADSGRLLVFCDEEADVSDPIAALVAARPQASALLPAETARAGLPLSVLIGPEGGFAEDERAALLQRPNTVRLALGPRILRADTAAVAALALVQAVLGDWRD